MVGFICNSLVIFEQFIGQKTVRSSNLRQDMKLLLPSITICGHSAFKEKVSKYEDLDIQSYKRNTLNKDEIGYLKAYHEDFRSPSEDLFLTKETYTLYRGRCYTIEYKNEVKNNQTISHVAPVFIGMNTFRLFVYK